MTVASTPALAICFDLPRPAQPGHSLAERLAREWAGLGGRARVLWRGEAPPAPEATPGGAEALLHLCAGAPPEAVPGRLNLLWQTARPAQWVPNALRRFAMVLCPVPRLVADLRAAGIAAAGVAVPVDLARFRPDAPGAGAAVDVVYVGAYGPNTPIPAIRAALDLGADVQVWGPGWAGRLPEAVWAGTHLAPEDLAALYARARIVLGDQSAQDRALGVIARPVLEALACGAEVVTAPLAPPAPAAPLPGLHPCGDDAIAALLAARLAAPADPAARLARHRAVAARHDLGVIARGLHAALLRAARRGAVTPPAFVARGAGTAPLVRLGPPCAGGDSQQAGLVAAATQIVALFAALEHPARAGFVPPPPLAPARQGVIHPLMPALRRTQARALAAGRAAAFVPDAQAIDDLTQARRILDLAEAGHIRSGARSDAALVWQMRGARQPGADAPAYDRDAMKPHVLLWPRRQPVALARPVGVFVHLYHADLAPVLAARLARIAAPHRVYVSTDTLVKARAIAQALPEAEIRIMANRGRDVWPKLYGWADVYPHHDVVLHVHGKRSRHAARLDGWLAEVLDCLLPEGDQINRILSFFATIPRLGLVAPLVHQPVLPVAHWGANGEIAAELAWRMGFAGPLPGNDALRFPVSSMFWARVDALRPLLDLGLTRDHFPPEQGQTDATTAHAIERLFGVVCEATGHELIMVAPAGSRRYARFQHRFRSNGDLRAAIEAGGPGRRA